MKFYGLGACREVGRSAFLIEDEAKTVLLDYGIKIFTQKNQPDYPKPLPLEPNIALISHAHMDHIGYLPALFKKRKVKWYATPPTLDIANILWRDNIKIAKLSNYPLPYTQTHIEKANIHWHPIIYNQTIREKGISFKFIDAGHILGSAQIVLRMGKRKVLYTGDFKGEKTRLHDPAKHENAEILIIEGTYADYNHPDREQLEKDFVDAVLQAVEEGVALIAAFALGRTQELIAVLRKYIKDVPIYVDGMGKEISKIYTKYPGYIKNYKEFVEAFDSVNLVNDARTRKKAQKDGNIIVTTAGMLEGGPVLHYLMNISKNSHVFLTGYQVEGTNGRMLLEEKKINIDGYTLEVPFNVHFFDFSAHAGRRDLLRHIENVNPEKIVIVHAEEKKAIDFAEELREKGYDAFAPKIGEVLEL